MAMIVNDLIILTWTADTIINPETYIGLGACNNQSRVALDLPPTEILDLWIEFVVQNCLIIW